VAEVGKEKVFKTPGALDDSTPAHDLQGFFGRGLGDRASGGDERVGFVRCLAKYLLRLAKR
jgi:hypothetical protein